MVDNSRAHACACYLLVICASFYLDYRLSFHSPLTPFAWGRKSFVRFALFCIWGPHKFSIFGESGSSSRLMTQASFIATCLLNANRLPKPYCALRSQHLLSQMHSLSITPELYSGTFPQKALLLRFPFPCTYPIPLGLKTKEEPRMNQGTPKELPTTQKCFLLRLATSKKSLLR